MRGFEQELQSHEDFYSGTQRNTLRGKFWRFMPPEELRQLLRSWSPFFDICVSFESAAIETVLRDVNVDIDRHLISYYASPFPST